jgi:flagellar biosynthetic protein FlhB
MADKNDSQEKTEEPTQKKREDAKKKGQVTRSKELVVYAMLLSSSVILFSVTPDIYMSLKEHTIHSFTFNNEQATAKLYMLELLILWSWMFIESMVPVLFITTITAIASSIMLGGWVMSIESVSPKMEKISFAKGLKRIFSSKGLMELIKSIAKVVLIGSSSYLIFTSYLPDMKLLADMPLEAASLLSVEMLGYFFLLSSSTLLLVVLIDVPFQIHSTQKELKMSKQEIKDEMKESEGRPEVKMQRRQIARKLAFSRQMDDIPTADVVVTNPTHYSIAIKYNSTDNAPIIVAMGTDMLALKIRTIARQYDVIIVESPPLARSLYYFSNIGEEIHPGLYDAVAKLLSYIYKLKNFNEFGGNEPMLDSIEIDKELRK